MTKETKETKYSEIEHKGKEFVDDKKDIVEEVPADEVEEVKPLKLKQPVVRKKKSLLVRTFNVLLGKEALKRTGTYLLKDVIMPALQDTAYNTLMSGGKMLIYRDKTYNAPETYNSRSRGGQARTSYNMMYNSAASGYESSNDYPEDSYEDVLEIEFSSPDDARYVLDEMNGIIRRRGGISVSEYYSLVDSTIITTYIMRTYGWTSVNQAVVRRTRSGRYIIDLPEPVDLQI